MTVTEILVTVGGLALVALILWYFFSEKAGVRLATSAEGVQEALVVVKGGYTPDVLVVRAGRPVRLSFNRQETSSCSEMVLFPDFNKSAQLPEGETVALEFTPEQPGEYTFQCQMGMLRGKLVAE
ncbi:MAG: cupredoxin domain-containing protein [Ardenticatenaceae bacterium]|nr:cupredoxin domain-containing protein [Ardenticatenaceae bacterium]